MTPYYQDSLVTIYHGDCREVLLEIDVPALVLTDPPYGTEDLGGGYGRRQNHDPAGKFGRRIANDKDLSVVADVSALLAKKLPSPGIVASFCAARRMNEVDSIFRSDGFAFFGELVWDKAAPGLGYTIRYSHESCLVYSRGEVPTPETAAISLVRSYVDRCGNASRHPHQKPVGFWVNAARLLPTAIIDPFMGSGSTLRAAKDLGRKAVGIELEECHCEAAAKLMQQEVLWPASYEQAKHEAELFAA